MKKTNYGNETNLNLKLIIGLNRSILYLRRNEAELIRTVGLTMAQFGVLEVLYHKGPLRVCQISEKTLSTGGNTTVVINNLMKEGLISRQRDAEDNRAFLVTLTSKGHELIDELFPKHLVNVDKEFQHLSIEEKEQLLMLLKKLNQV